MSCLLLTKIRKAISVTILISFIFTNTAHAISIPRSSLLGTSLRIPLGFENSEGEERGYLYEKAKKDQNEREKEPYQLQDIQKEAEMFVEEYCREQFEQWQIHRGYKKGTIKITPPSVDRDRKIVDLSRFGSIPIPHSEDPTIYRPHMGRGQTSWYNEAAAASEGRQDANSVIRYLKAYEELRKNATIDSFIKATEHADTDRGPYMFAMDYLRKIGVEREFLILIHIGIFVQETIRKAEKGLTLMYSHDDFDYWLFSVLLKKFQEVYFSQNKLSVSNLEIGTYPVVDPYGEGEINLERFVSGAGLKDAYIRLLRIKGHKSRLDAVDSEHIISRAERASLKESGAKDEEDKVCLSVVLKSIERLAEAIVDITSQQEERDIKVVLFGGLAEGGGNFYLKTLQEKVNEFSGEGKEIKIVLSSMGDERAIIGAVGYVLFVSRVSNPEGKYAIAVDLGGTNIRAGRVNLETMEVEGEIVKCPTLPVDESINGISTSDLMKVLSKKLQENSMGMDFSNLPEGLENFLREEEDRKNHSILTEFLLEQIELLIRRLDLEDVGMITLASAGIFEEKGPVKLAYNLPITGVDLREEIKKELSIPVYMGNDVACAAVGEAVAGAGKGYDIFYMLNVGTGLNMSLVEGQVVMNPFFQKMDRVIKVQNGV